MQIVLADQEGLNPEEPEVSLKHLDVINPCPDYCHFWHKWQTFKVQHVAALA